YLCSVSLDRRQELLDFIKDRYGVEQISHLDKDLIFYENKSITKRNVVLMRGNVLKNHISKNELVDEIDGLCKDISRGVRETVESSSNGEGKIELNVESEAVVAVLSCLSEIMGDKVKEFNVRSDYYSNILGICIFFIMFGFFFFVWNLIKI
ncbi:MAG TPA: hypothetical protein DEO68_03595, partial [Halomonas campaniensis]|nr:hypothetical protein [Halomonas campaniensis]